MSTQTNADNQASILQSARIEDAATAQAQSVREEAVKRTEGQRNTSMLWEKTQKILAQQVIAIFLGAHMVAISAGCLVLVIYWKAIVQWPAGLAVLVALMTGALGSVASLASLVIGFYFSRTNHSRIGGVGGDDAAGIR